MEDTKYLVKILPAEGCNPEFAPDAEDQEGHELDGYVLLGFVGGEMRLACAQGINVTQIADGIRENHRKASSLASLRAAFAIAEAEIKAWEIFEASEKRAQHEFLKGLFEGRDGDDEAGD